MTRCSRWRARRAACRPRYPRLAPPPQSPCQGKLVGAALSPTASGSTRDASSLTCGSQHLESEVWALGLLLRPSQRHQPLAGFHRLSRLHVQAFDDGGRGGGDLVLHLHGLEHRERPAMGGVLAPALDPCPEWVRSCMLSTGSSLLARRSSGPPGVARARHPSLAGTRAPALHNKYPGKESSR